METEVKKRKIPAAVIAAIAALAVVGLVIGGYCGLCSWVRDNGRLLPGIVAADASGEVTLDMSKMLPPDAVLAMEKEMKEYLGRRVVTIRYDGGVEHIDGSHLKMDPQTPVDIAVAHKAEQPFIRLGALWLGLIKAPVELSLSAAVLTDEGAAEAERLAEHIADAVYIEPVNGSWAYDDEKANVLVTRGTEGRRLDAEKLAEVLKQTLLEGNADLEAEYIVLPNEDISALTIHDLTYEAPVDPYLQEDGTLTLPKYGVSVDVENTQSLLDAALPGETCAIPLIYTMPDFSTCQHLLYQDELSGNVSTMDGVAARSFNVRRTAEFCNEVILLPGEVFSYLGTIGDPSVANGYMMSTGYQNGKTVEMEGGGACQVSSALYYCAVYANLEIVWRANHAFVVTYVPKGLDATVYYPSLDFRFRNNTPYPIKIVTSSEESDWGKVTVKILGTKTDDTYVVPEIIELYSTPWKTVYKPDETIPAGTTKVDVTPYTGYAVDVYRCVYDGEGNQISRTYENFSKYAKRDKVILFNPADAEQLGLNPDGTPLPAAAAEGTEG